VNVKIYVVRKGDTLWRISQQYGVSTNQIVKTNGLEYPDKLLIGQALLIPQYLSYKVQQGDTLAKIAIEYGVSLQTLLQTNHLSKPTNIYPGLKINIPVEYYIVRNGDTLNHIAQLYGTTTQALIKMNRLINPANLFPGQKIKIPLNPKPVVDVNAFTNVYGETGASQAREVAYDLTYVSPFGYRMREDGTLEAIADVPIIKVAHENRVIPMMAITNFSSTQTGTQLAHSILTNSSLVEKLLTTIIQTMDEKGYRGLNIDFENVMPLDRKLYNDFLTKAVERLHPKGFFVSSSLAPKTNTNQKGLLVEAHDYAAHGQVLDFVVLMTYEWGYRKGPPQAISPLNQIKNVLDYAVTVIPRNKILLGFQIYARDWLVPHEKGQEAETFDMQEAIRRAVKYDAEILFDQVTKSPHYTYKDEQGRSHEVWFEDARSAKAKFDLVRSYKLRGISYWVLGYPFPQNWELLSTTFTIRKF
jgi:spore germination protein